MAVRAENQFAARDMILHHHLMAHALPLPEVDPMLSGKIPHLLLGSGGLGAVRGYVVVHDPYKLRGVRNPGIL